MTSTPGSAPNVESIQSKKNPAPQWYEGCVGSRGTARASPETRPDPRRRRHKAKRDEPAPPTRPWRSPRPSPGPTARATRAPRRGPKLESGRSRSRSGGRRREAGRGIEDSERVTRTSIAAELPSSPSSRPRGRVPGSVGLGIRCRHTERLRESVPGCSRQSQAPRGLWQGGSRLPRAAEGDAAPSTRATRSPSRAVATRARWPALSPAAAARAHPSESASASTSRLPARPPKKPVETRKPPGRARARRRRRGRQLKNPCRLPFLSLASLPSRRSSLRPLPGRPISTAHFSRPYKL